MLFLSGNVWQILLKEEVADGEHSLLMQILEGSLQQNTKPDVSAWGKNRYSILTYIPQWEANELKSQNMNSEVLDPL